MPATSHEKTAGSSRVKKSGFGWQGRGGRTRVLKKKHAHGRSRRKKGVPNGLIFACRGNIKPDRKRRKEQACLARRKKQDCRAPECGLQTGKNTGGKRRWGARAPVSSGQEIKGKRQRKKKEPLSTGRKKEGQRKRKPRPKGGV